MANVNDDIQSPLFDLCIEKYERNLNTDVNESFAIPKILEGICKVIFLHNQYKSVKYKRIPDDTVFVDNVDKCLEWLNPMIQKESRELFQKLDKQTVSDMRKPTFRSAVVAFFYLEGLWNASWEQQDFFFNRNGTVRKDLESIGFSHVRVIVRNGVLTSHVEYLDSRRQQNYVRFTMPNATYYEDGIYENCLLIVPKVEVEYRRDDTHTLGSTVINFKYKHDENGFKAAGVYSKVSCDGGSRFFRKFVLDKPFEIMVYYKNEEMLKVLVENVCNNY